jgi:SAM-dependent methyltransferase
MSEQQICQCGGTAFFNNTLRTFNFYDCSFCSLRFVHPRYLDEAIYDSDYFDGASHGFGFSNYEEDKTASSSYLGFLLRRVHKLVSGQSNTLLDIGAANGFFVSLASTNGFKSKGIELSEDAVNWALRLGRDVRKTSIEEFKAEESFDVVTILDVLEHLAEPRETLQMISQFLNHKGILVINVPDRSSIFARICGYRWHAYLPPEHWFYFNRKSISELLEQTGFQVVEMGNLSKSFTVSYILKTISNSPQFPKPLRFVADIAIKLLRGWTHKIKIKVPLYDNLYIIATLKEKL